MNQCSHKLNVLFFDPPSSFCEPRSFMRRARRSQACSKFRMEPEAIYLDTWSGRGDSPRPLAFSGRLATSLEYQASCWGGTVAVDRTRTVGSTKKKQQIVRLPGLVGSIKLTFATRCWRVLGQARTRPAGVEQCPRCCTRSWRFSKPYILRTPS